MEKLEIFPKIRKIMHDLLCDPRKVMVKFDEDRIYIECQQCSYVSEGVRIKETTCPH